jgi:hypothetical protein
MSAFWTAIGIGLGAGLALGALQLGWMWLSLRAGPRPGAARVLGHAAARIGLVLAGLWALAHWVAPAGPALAGALAGLLAARTLGIRAARRPGRGGS